MMLLPTGTTVGQLKQALEGFDDTLPVLLHTGVSWPSWPRCVCNLQMVYQKGVEQHIRIKAGFDKDPPWPAVVISTTRGLDALHPQDEE